MTYRDLLLKCKNLDEEVDFNNIIEKSIKDEAYIFIKGHEDKKIYINGDMCYEVSLKIPGIFSFNESQEIVELLLGNDWRIPTKEELNLIYRNLRVAGHILDKDYYWSSTSYKNDFAWCQYFGDGGLVETSKYNRKRVCAIRPFKKGVVEKDIKDEDIENSLNKFTKDIFDYIHKEHKFESEIEQEIRRRLSLEEKGDSFTANQHEVSE